MPGSEVILKEMALYVLKLEIIALNVVQPVALLIFKIFSAVSTMLISHKQQPLSQSCSPGPAEFIA